MRRDFAGFRETRLYAQVLLSGGLVALVWLSQTFPVGPLVRVQSAARWTVSHQTDLAGSWQRARSWAERQGGWTAAAEAALGGARGKVQGWVAGRIIPAPGRNAAVGSEPTLRLSEPPVLPVQGALLTPFGWSVGHEERFHNGIDLVAEAGTPVVAVTAGEVRRVGSSPELGTFVEVQHGPVLAVYAEVAGVLVQAGQPVRKAEVIASVAKSRTAGTPQPAHLHFEVRTGADLTPIDPAAYLGLGGTRL